MPKMKTNAGAKKRFHLTATGRVKRRKAFRSHILSTKTRKRKRQLRKGGLVSVADEKHIRMMLHP